MMKAFDSLKSCGQLGCAMLLIQFIAQPVYASDEFEKYRSQQNQDIKAAKNEYVKYREKEDQEFASFLKSQWREFETYRGIVRIKEPKPKKVPVAPTIKSKPAPSPKITHPPITRPIAVPPTKPVPQVAEPIHRQPHKVQPIANTKQIVFYGNLVEFSFDERWSKYRLPLDGARPDTMSAFWTMMSGSKYESTIADIRRTRQELGLDDWGHVSLWREVAKTLQPGHQSEQNLLLWYFLVKSGYDVRLGYSGSNIHLFVAVKQQIYSTKFTKVGNQTYYAVMAADYGDSIGSFYTYEASYPNRLSALDIRSASTGFTKAIATTRALTFGYKGDTIRLNVPYDQELVEYMGSYPQSEFELYFDTDGSSILHRGLIAELKQHTAKMEGDEAINFLLAFVQQSFAYKTDDEQFGREKYFFVEESLHYPFNDCEDRSVFFSWLVLNVTGAKVVGLVYPGHMTTAVNLKKVRPEYATIDYQGHQMVIADPTYIGATIGMAMPSYEKLKPRRVVEIQQ